MPFLVDGVQLNQRTDNDRSLSRTYIHLKIQQVQYWINRFAFVSCLTCACVSLWGACAVKAQRAGSHAHADLLHPDSLQMHEESRLAGQAAIVVGAGQTATLLAP